MSYIETIRDLETRLFNLHPQAKELYTLINGLKGIDQKVEHSVTLEDGRKLYYAANYPVADKIVFALHHLGFTSNVGDIERTIRKFEPTFNKGLSTALTKLQEAGTIRTTGSRPRVYYMLKEWLDTNGIIKDKYRL